MKKIEFYMGRYNQHQVSVNFSKKKLLDMEKPFAFYLVDKKRQEIKQKKIKEAQEAKMAVKPFRANTVPSSTYEPRYELLKMEEQRRASKIEERAKKLMAESKMPPRMDVENNSHSFIPIKIFFISQIKIWLLSLTTQNLIDFKPIFYCCEFFWKFFFIIG